MPVHIDTIQVKNLGPIRRFKMELGSINLIYGRNEEGKTALVEFIVRSLFRQVKTWNLRFEDGEGKVRVSGLTSNPIDFSPSSSVKMDDYWTQNETGLPPDFARLLVVKGAETRLSEGSPVSRTDLQRFLSNRDILDRIESRISKTIRKCSVEDGRIMGPEQGENRERKAVLQRYDAIETLFTQLDKGYSGGRRRKLNDRKLALELEIQELDRAKRHLAWMKDGEIERLKKEFSQIDDDRLTKVRSDIHLFKKSLEGIQEKTRRLEEVNQKTKHFRWLRQAETQYQGLMEKRAPLGRSLSVLIGGVFLLLATLLVYINLLIPAGISLFVGVVLFVLFFSSALKKIRTKTEVMELIRLKEAFKDRFHSPLKTLSDLQGMIVELEKPFTQAGLLAEELEKDQAKIEELSFDISRTMLDLTGKQLSPDHWDNLVAEIQGHLDHLRSAIHTTQIDLERLQVHPSEYIEEPSEKSYHRETHQALEEELTVILESLDDDEKKLDDLKQRICVQTGDKISSSWESVIQKLKDVREEILESYRTHAADILGKTVVSSVLLELRHDEEEKIEEGLRSPGVLEPLHLITGRYTDLKLEETGIVVSDGFNDFPLNQLSTGTKEQVLLALRIGLARRWLDRENESCFLVLDDAFQYSDWKRRESLMQMAVNLAKHDWQIIYFSMDDHIRDLFRKAAKPFGDRFRDVTLSVEN